MHRNTIRVGVMGAGYWGMNLVRVTSQLGVLDCVCDTNDAMRQSVKKQYPTVDVVSQPDDLLSRSIDAVIIATPAQTHATLCLSALRAGKHVFVEKPLALSVAEGKLVVEAAEATQRTVFVGHVVLYHPAVRRLRELLSEGAIGRVWHLRSRRLSLGKLRSFENVWWSFAPHDVAIMIAIMGEEPCGVVAAQGSRYDQPSDVAYADFAFSGDRSAHIEVCWLDPNKSAQLDIFGDQGVLTLNDSRTGSSLLLRRFAVGTDDWGNPAVARGEEVSIGVSGEEPLKAEIRAFIQSVQTGAPSETSAQAGLAVLTALSMADEAASKSVELRAPA